jgi:hypothetical protein
MISHGRTMGCSMFRTPRHPTTDPCVGVSGAGPAAADAVPKFD